MRTCLTSLILFLLFTSNATATNHFFFPGDAFFHSLLTKKVVRHLAKRNDLTLEYKRPYPDVWAGCGYSGCSNFKFTADSKPLIKNLAALHRELYKANPSQVIEYKSADGGSEKVEEENRFHVFIHNKDFDPTKYKMMLRYNENWVEEQEWFGGHVGIEFFIYETSAVVKEWRDAKKVPRLKLTYPPQLRLDQPRTANMGLASYIPEPVGQDGPIQAIVTESTEIKDYYSAKEGTRFYSVTNEGIKRYTRNGRSWDVVDWNPTNVKKKSTGNK